GKAYLLAAGSGHSYFEWTALLLLSMMAIMLLPRQFQMSVVENYNEDHLRKASWLLPLYLLLINLFVLPIALGGVLSTGQSIGAESFVLTLPLMNGSKAIVLLVFIGGFAAATGMVIVESVALSTMVMNSLVMPVLVKFGKDSSLPSLVINIKRFVIMCIVFIGYFFAISIGGFYSLVDMGLKSFEAVSLFAPAFFIGLYWKKAGKKAVAAGLIAGFVIWIYTLMIPATIKAGLLDSSGLAAYLQGFSMLNPEALFGVPGLGKWSHTLFWSMLVNLLLFFGISVVTKQSKEEELQALVFVESYNRRISRSGSYGLDITTLRELLHTYLGYEDAERLIKKFLEQKNKNENELSDSDMTELWHEAEEELSGAFGPGISALIFNSRFMLNAKEQQNLSESIHSITETLRLSKEELADANRQLSYLKEFSENIIESAPVGIVIVDRSLAVNYFNSEMQRLAGLSRSEAMSKKITDVLPWFTARGFDSSGKGDFIVNGPAGRVFHVNVSLFKDPSGGFVIVFEEITEKIKMEEQLKQASKLASIGKLTAGLSHEIGNPLASISSLVQELMHIKTCSPENTEFTKEALDAIHSNIERIAKIVRSLGDFARVAPPHKIPASVVEILQQTLDLVKFDKRFAETELSLDLNDVPEVNVNRDQMQQVFLNLILNALDAMHGKGRLSISVKSIGRDVEIVFSDTGAGIDEESLQKIFDPFFTTKPYGRGTGLGLSICYGIINDHGGTLTVRSKKGEGAAFIIRLPVHSDARSDTDS
ncbi:MAG: PAS domain-containing protein, partial [Nitrospiraceae bacterium]|nr:PAS domain-containing protein [Nitrospiraceae bacterium]